MLLVSCHHCLTIVRVMPDLNAQDDLISLVGEGSEFWPDKYKCISCDQPCVGMDEAAVDNATLMKMKVRDLKPREFFAALHGLGTPDEMVCDLPTVRELLIEKKIKQVRGYTVRGTTRTCLHELELEDGTRLYFGSSPQGALVFRIARPISYTQKVLEELDR